MYGIRDDRIETGMGMTMKEKLRNSSWPPNNMTFKEHTVRKTEKGNIDLFFVCQIIWNY